MVDRASLLTSLGVAQSRTRLKRLSSKVTLVAQTVKRLSAMQKTRVRYLGWEDPLEKEMAARSSILAWRIPWTEEPGGAYSPWGCSVSFSIFCQCYFLIEV